MLISCASIDHKDNIYVFKYKDFGPPVIATNLIGQDWWQWQSHGDSRPKKYDIKIVVYKNIELQEVKKCYPVVASKRQDYRYLAYPKALKYLNEHIADNVIETLTSQLTITKNKIIAYFGDK